MGNTLKDFVVTIYEQSRAEEEDWSNEKATLFAEDVTERVKRDIEVMQQSHGITWAPTFTVIRQDLHTAIVKDGDVEIEAYDYYGSTHFALMYTCPNCGKRYRGTSHGTVIDMGDELHEYPTLQRMCPDCKPEAQLPEPEPWHVRLVALLREALDE